MDIVRSFPEFKNIIPYPDVYTSLTFKEYELIKNDKELWHNYCALDLNISYKTFRKIKRDSKTWNNLHKEFCQNIRRKIRNAECNFYIINDIQSLDEKEYFISINDTLNNIKIENDKIEIYNNDVSELIKNIKLLKWNECIEFQGIKYGISPCQDEIHHENDCGGLILSEFKFNSLCIICMNSKKGCGKSCTTPTMISRKCNKCNTDFKVKLNTWTEFVKGNYRIVSDEVVKRTGDYV